MNTSDQIAVTSLLVSMLGFPLSYWLGCRAGRKSEAHKRQLDEIQSKRQRRDEFIRLAIDFQTHIAMPDAMAAWVSLFITNAPKLKSEFTKIRHELSAADRKKMGDSVDALTKFAAMENGEVYARHQVIHDTFNGITRTS
jgi:hypothetical protein